MLVRVQFGYLMWKSQYLATPKVLILQNFNYSQLFSIPQYRDENCLAKRRLQGNFHLYTEGGVHSSTMPNSLGFTISSLKNT
jgi:hypothetical protein